MDAVQNLAGLLSQAHSQIPEQLHIRKWNTPQQTLPAEEICPLEIPGETRVHIGRL